MRRAAVPKGAAARLRLAVGRCYSLISEALPGLWGSGGTARAVDVGDLPDLISTLLPSVVSISTGKITMMARPAIRSASAAR